MSVENQYDTYTTHTNTQTHKRQSEFFTMEPGWRTITIFLIFAIMKIVGVPIPEELDKLIRLVYVVIVMLNLLNGLQWLYRLADQERERMIMRVVNMCEDGVRTMICAGGRSIRKLCCLTIDLLVILKDTFLACCKCCLGRPKNQVFPPIFEV